ncbi:MAG: hypothetical protein JWO67_1445 [Streptosporangiaceae bacterium]|nr:hypothetical protein [Streptosporangiaceae bacterium]
MTTPELSNADIMAFAAEHDIDGHVAPDQNGTPQVWIDEASLRKLADTAPIGSVAAHALVDQILAATREGSVSDD